MTLPGDSVKLVTLTNQMPFFYGPEIHPPIQAYLDINTILNILEGPASANPKLGQEQWIFVQTLDGRLGYVLGSRVGLAPQSGSSSASSALTGNMVKLIAAGGAERSQPIVSPSTLIQYYNTGTLFTATNPQANQKIGTTGQWLQVTEQPGRTGYVAAWYHAGITNADSF